MDEVKYHPDDCLPNDYKEFCKNEKRSRYSPYEQPSYSLQKSEGQEEPEFIELSSVEPHDLIKCCIPPGDVGHPSLARNLNPEQLKNALQHHDHFQIMVFPEIESVLKFLNNHFAVWNQFPELVWEDGWLMKDGVRTKFRADYIFDAVYAIAKFSSSEQAEDAVARIIYTAIANR